MSIILILKALLLTMGILFVVPVVFAVTLLLGGHHFSLSIAKDSWLARSKNRFVRALVSRCA